MSAETSTQKVPEALTFDLSMRMDLFGPRGRMWGFSQDYEHLPPAYLLEIASACRSFLEYLRGLATTARAAEDEGGGQTTRVGGAPAASVPAGLEYRVDFRYSSDVLLPPPFDDLFEGEVGVPYLKYSVAVQAQRAGHAMLGRLIESAEIEIASGQRQ